EQVDGWLADEGLAVEAPVHLMVRRDGDDDGGGQEGETTDADIGAVPRGAVTAGVDADWAPAHGVGHGGGGGEPARDAGDTAGARRQALGASLAVEGEVAGVGFGVLDDGWLGVFGMGTAPAHRRRGIATDVLLALLAAGRARGADRAYLQVETDNPGAIALYR